MVASCADTIVIVGFVFVRYYLCAIVETIKPSKVADCVKSVLPRRKDSVVERASSMKGGKQTAIAGIKGKWDSTRAFAEEVASQSYVETRVLRIVGVKT